MNDLIPRAAAIEAFDDERVDRNYGDVSPESVIEVIESIPAVDAAPVVHSSWHSTPDGHVYCGSCRFPLAKTRVLIEGVDKYLYLTTKYCPNCGAKMDLEV